MAIPAGRDPAIAAPQHPIPYHPIQEDNVNTTTVSIDGMTCGHCVNAVTEEIEALDGVQGVAVELVKGGISTATVTSTRPIDEATISEAVAEAGYTVVSNNA
jgi:copper chaperone CopZ